MTAAPSKMNEVPSLLKHAVSKTVSFWYEMGGDTGDEAEAFVDGGKSEEPLRGESGWARLPT